jgi:hypothetical protein
VVDARTAATTAATIALPPNNPRRIASLPLAFATPAGLAPAFKASERISCAAQSAAPEREKPKDESWRNSGAGEGIRTLDPDLGKVVLYP